MHNIFQIKKKFQIQKTYVLKIHLKYIWKNKNYYALNCSMQMQNAFVKLIKCLEIIKDHTQIVYKCGPIGIY